MDLQVSLDKHAQTAVISIDNPPVNALSHGVRSGLIKRISEAASDQQVTAIVLICKGRTFIAGADIKEFGKAPVKPYLPDVLEALDNCPKPIIAALHGTALGGGLETALACRYRIADDSAVVGLPEVKLGLIPGAGGTQRLPRIAGLENAIDMISSGRHISAQEAIDMGLIDKLTGGKDLLDTAIEFASQIVESGQLRRRVSDIEIQNSSENRHILESWKVKVSKKARGQTSPLVALESIANTLLLAFDEGLRKERELFDICRTSVQSKALQHVFFAERAAAKLPASLHAEPTEIISTAVVGGGTMGRGIAMCLANANIPVVIVETDQNTLKKALKGIDAAYTRMLASGRINQSQKKTRISNISGSCDHSSLATVDLVIEAAFEEMTVKRQIFSSLDKHCRPNAILTTNTSYLDLESIASVVQDPSRVIGMHFFSPAHVMKLLEVVRTSQTSASAISTVIKLAKQLGKRCVLVANGFGFAANRMYAAYQAEGQQMLLEGVTPTRLDQAMKNWGMAMGPLAVLDMSGIDIGYKARQQNPNPPIDPGYFRPADMLVEHGRLGRKTGRGFYRYDHETGGAQEDMDTIHLIREESKRLQVEPQNLSEKQIQHRMIQAISTEGERILAAGIAFKSSDLDVIWVNGYGFPRWRGGPMFFCKFQTEGEISS
jgi:3-hydroxyacyl-CoA dehydrogenase